MSMLVLLALIQLCHRQCGRTSWEIVHPTCVSARNQKRAAEDEPTTHSTVDRHQRRLCRTASVVILRVDKLLSDYGTPGVLRPDNGPQFNSCDCANTPEDTVRSPLTGYAQTLRSKDS